MRETVMAILASALKIGFCCIVLLPAFGTLSIECKGQVSWSSNQDWEQIRAQHQAGKLHDTIYLARAQALTELSFKNPELEDKLSEYRTIAWSKPAYRPFRVKYYAFLANHATLLHQDGYAVYYLQKMEDELKMISPYVNSLNQPRLMLSIYGEKGNSNYDKRIAIIDSVMPFLKTLPGALSKGPVNINTCINAFTILKHAAKLYTVSNEKSKVIEIQGLARAIWLQLQKKRGANKGKLTQCQLSLYLIESDAAKVLGKAAVQADYLNAAYGIIVSNDTTIVPLFKNPFKGTVLTRLIDFYIERKQIDSAGYFLGLYKADVNRPNRVRNEDGTKFLRYAGRMDAERGNYKAAYESILRAYEMNDSIIAVKTADIHNNMHAHLVAEQRNITLLAEQEKIGRRNILIFVVTAVLIMTVMLFLWLLRANRAKANRQIEKLNETTQIQIAELESHANEIRKRLGLDLHDDIAGRLVNLVNHIESQMMTVNEDREKTRLSLISAMAREVYLSARSKSHEWYSAGSDNDKMLFSQRVRQIVTLALADERYEKQIEIDDTCLEEMPVETRIDLLRIIQEAVSNILKHAKASRIKLFIYQDDDAVIVQIADNGRGFDVQARTKQKGLGLASLRKRAREMNGTIEITSSEMGTELLLSVPSVHA